MSDPNSLSMLPRILAVAAGGLLLGSAAGGVMRRRMSLPIAGVMVLAGVALALTGAVPAVWHLLGRISAMGRVRWFMGLVSGLVLLVAIESIRRSHLRERYALLWVGTALLVLAGALFPELLMRASTALGMQYVSLVVAVVFTFLLLVAFHFSIALSEQEEDKARLAQRCALLEARIERLERGAGAEHLTPNAEPPGSRGPSVPN